MHPQNVLSLLCFHTLGSLAVQLPLPPGPFNVTLVTGELVDYGRQDPFAPQPQPRALMVSVFEPANCHQTVDVPYMPPLTASYYAQNLSSSGIPVPNDVFEKLQLPVCAGDGVDECEVVDSPVILFSPGLSAPRLFYNVMASAVASYGFSVVTIDHPYDGTIVEYPDGHAVYDIIGGDDLALINQDVEVRAQDVSFVIDQLGNATAAAALTTRKDAKFKADKVAMFGHSLGGATTAKALQQDARVVGGINFDGTIFSDVPETGLSQPFILFAHENSTDPSWDQIWPRLREFKLQLELADSLHDTFLDGAIDLETLGLTDLRNQADSLVGNLPGKRTVEIVSTYVTTFVKFVLGGDEDDILKGPSAAFPEVSYVRQGQN